MAFFKFRQSNASPAKTSPRTAEAAANASTETVESLRRRARHRLIGAVVLVLVAVIGFPLLFDTQPRPVAINAPITIPDRDSAAPLAAPKAPKAADVAAPASLSEREEVVSPAAKAAGGDAASKPAPASASAARAPDATPAPVAAPPVRDDDAKAKAKAAQEDEARAKARRDEQAKAQAQEAKAKAQQEAEAKARREADARKQREEAARARAALAGGTPPAAKPAASAAGGDAGRFIVQIGAFAESDKAQEARQKAERAGLKTYTQVVDTKDGKRTRVRVGPFSDRAEADKAAARIKALYLSASVLTL